MTRYEPKTLRGDFLGMEPHPAGDYVRHEVAQALYDALLAIRQNSFYSDSTGYYHLHPEAEEAASAALAIAEK